MSTFVSIFLIMMVTALAAGLYDYLQVRWYEKHRRSGPPPSDGGYDITHEDENEHI